MPSVICVLCVVKTPWCPWRLGGKKASVPFVTYVPCVVKKTLVSLEP